MKKLDKYKILRYILAKGGAKILNFDKIDNGKVKVWFFTIVVSMSGTLHADLDIFMGQKCWLNTGTAGIWQRKLTWDIAPYPDSIYIHSSFCDLDNDGDYDAYVTGGDDNFTVAFENIGSDTVPIWQPKSSWNFNPPDMGLLLINPSANPQINHVIWDGTDDNGKIIKGGIYFCKLQADNYTVTKKLCLIK